MKTEDFDKAGFTEPCLVILVGPSGSGKSAWAASHFDPEEIVSSDRLRAVVGEGEGDQEASADAFRILDQVVEARLRRRLVTVIDTLGLDDAKRERWRHLARETKTPVFLVVFDTSAEMCRARNRSRSRPVPAAALTAQLRRFRQIRNGLVDEGFDAVMTVTGADRLEATSTSSPSPNVIDASPRFMLQVSRFPWKAEELAERLGGIAQAAEGAGFAGLAVMDHFIQIPKVGRHWEIIPEGYTTLSFLSALTRRLRLGVLVTGVTYRNLGLLGKMVATLDVLSGGRAFCGLGAAWFEREHEAYGFTFPPARQRLDILEDALQVLPLLWGPGSPPFTGKTMTMAETTCYPRPLQEKIPIIVGGGGERRTLRLAARYADACNLGGSVDVVKHKREVLGQHCREVGRDPNSIEITHLTNLRVGEMGSGTLRRHVDGFRRLREEGVTTFFVSVSDLTGTEQIEMLVPVMAALR